jgi:hypothetical protein
LRPGCSRESRGSACEADYIAANLTDAVEWIVSSHQA